MSEPTEICGDLRGAAFRGDDAALLAILRERPWPEHALQPIGDGLGGGGCPHGRPGGRVGPGLRVGAAGAWLARRRRAGRRRRVSVGNGAIDLTTGAVRQGIDGAYFEPEEDVDFDDPDRWLLVHCEGSRPGCRGMANFIADVEDPRARGTPSPTSASGAGLESGWPGSYWPVWGAVALSSGQ